MIGWTGNLITERKFVSDRSIFLQQDQRSELLLLYIDIILSEPSFEGITFVIGNILFLFSAHFSIPFF